MESVGNSFIAVSVGRAGRLLVASIVSLAMIFWPVAVSANATSDPEGTLESGGVVVGGEAQSVDPTRYDYVPEGGDEISPRSASGYAWIPAFQYSFGGITISVPGAQIYHRINGAGLHISEEVATYSAPANICNYRFDFQNRDLNSRIISTRSTGTHQGCQFGMVGHSPLRNFDVQPGMMCAKLYVSGAFRGEQCHHITR